MASDIFKFFTAGFILAMVGIAITNGDKTAQILSSFYSGYNGTIYAAQGQTGKA